MHNYAGQETSRYHEGLELGKTHKSIFSRKASFGCLGVGVGEGFAGGRFKKSVKNRFLTKQIFEI